MPLNIDSIRSLLYSFDFQRLFIEELGWNQPTSPRQLALDLGAMAYQQRQIAELGGVVVFEITTAGDRLPDAKQRAAIAKEVEQLHYENVLIFLGEQRTQSLWYWVRRDGGRRIPRNHFYFRHQPPDLFLSNISAMFVDISELDANGDITLVDVTRRLRAALDIEQVTRKFFSEYEEIHRHLLLHIQGISDERDLRWYASVLLNRLMFVYFLQRKFFLDGGDGEYLQHRRAKFGGEQFYATFLQTLFFEGFAKPEPERAPGTTAIIGRIRYLNGGLFLRHPIEERYAGRISIPDAVFDDILALFTRYTWNLDDAPGGRSDEIRPEVLGYIFEKYINQKAFGAYYTRSEITEYLCEQTINRLILERVNELPLPGRPPAYQFDSVNDLLAGMDAPLCWKLLGELPTLSLLDPSCGSGAFLVAALQTLLKVYTGVYGYIEMRGDHALKQELARIRAAHGSLSYYVKKKIISENLFGVDIMEEAVEIARLRLFLALASSARSVDELEPLPNIDFNILPGNSLIGWLRVDEHTYDHQTQLSMLHTPYRTLVHQKNMLVKTYRDLAGTPDELRSQRDTIEEHRAESNRQLNELLLDEFRRLGIKYEQATWDAAAGRESKPRKRAVTISDITALRPFHWGYEFDEVLHERGGFDAILTNPPWEIFKPQAKEFFAEYNALVSKNKMTIKEFEEERDRLLQRADVRDAWLEYQSRFPHQSAFFRAAPDYANQISVVNGKKAGTDINLYKLFVERCFHLLRPGGQCGIIAPGGIYTDLGTKQLREMLFTQATTEVLFGLSNEKFIFEGVHHAQKLCLLVFQKGGQTDEFWAAFRINPREAVHPTKLASFLKDRSEHIHLSVSLIRNLAPNSLSVMEFHSPADVAIAEKMAEFPLLGENLPGTWNLALGNEFHMTNDSHLFHTTPGSGRLPLIEGKMIHQFTDQWSFPKYWLIEEDARRDLVGRRLRNIKSLLKDANISADTDSLPITLDYESYRLAFRDVSQNSNERTFIATILPPHVFCPHTMSLEKVYHDYIEDNQLILNVPALDARSRLFATAVLNSFVIDYLIRQRVTTHVSFFFVYQLPIPRLTDADARFGPIVARAARLICTAPEFDELARAAGLEDHRAGARDPAERAELRAELDGLVAHLYGLSEDELAHILASFPLVEPSVKDAALHAYRALAPDPDDAQVARLIAGGESGPLEFKIGAIHDPHRRQRNDAMKHNVVETVAAFLNSYEGGTLIIGVENATNRVVGIADDMREADPRKPDRDGYELWLRNVIDSELGADLGVSYAISFHTIAPHDVCRIRVQPGRRAAYLRNGDFYIRTGNRKRKLTAREAVEYAQRRFR